MDKGNTGELVRFGEFFMHHHCKAGLMYASKSQMAGVVEQKADCGIHGGRSGRR